MGPLKYLSTHMNALMKRNMQAFVWAGWGTKYFNSHVPKRIRKFKLKACGGASFDLNSVASHK